MDAAIVGCMRANDFQYRALVFYAHRVYISTGKWGLVSDAISFAERSIKDMEFLKWHNHTIMP